MITSNINSTLLNLQLQEELKQNQSNNSFIDSLIDSKEVKANASFNYEDIKKLSFEEISTIFKNDEEKDLANNLKLATMFTNDKYLGQALFDTVLGMPFSLGYNYLFDRYEDKNSFFSSLNNDSSLSDLLYESVSKKIANKNSNSTDVIPQEYLDRVLLEVNSFNFISALSNSSKNSYDKYKDEDKDYSFLYNDYYLKYQELIQKYENEKYKERNLLEQFR